MADTVEPNTSTQTMRCQPRQGLDATQIVFLASMGCPNEEIAAVVNCSVDTLNQHYAEEIDRGKMNGRARLRKMQWDAALRGNSSVLIWLGKNFLKQSDTVEISGKDGGPVQRQQVLDVARLTDEELHFLKRMHERQGMLIAKDD